MASEGHAGRIALERASAQSTPGDDSDSSSGSDSVKPARLKIRTMKQELLYCVDLPLSDPRSALIAIQDIKLELQSVLGIPPVAQFLVYKGQYLSNSKTLGDYSLPAAPRPVKLEYLRRRNKRGVHKPRAAEQHPTRDEDGSMAGALSLQAAPLSGNAPPPDMDELESHEATDSDDDSDASTHEPRAAGAASGNGDTASSGSGSVGDQSGLFVVERDASWDSASSNSSHTDLFQATASQVAAAAPARSVPLLLQGKTARSNATERFGSQWVNEWQPEQVCEEQGDSHRSTVVYFTASAMVAQQLARHFTWKVKGSYTSAVVAQAHSRATARHKETIRQVRMQRRLQQMDE